MKTQHETIYITDENDPSTTDGLMEEDEALYTTRPPSSVWRYHPSTPAETRTKKRVVMRVTQHDGAPPLPTQRASRQGTQTSQRRPTPQPQRKHKPVKKAVRRFHWLFYVGSSMVVGIALWAVGSAAVSFEQTIHDNLTYGTPRTFQVDANVGHQGISHFITQNLNGDIVIIEENPSNLAQSHLYQGPEYTGPGADDYVATLSFKDVTGNGKLDMIIAVNNQRFVWINDGTGFRPSTPSDHIDQQEVNEP